MIGIIFGILFYAATLLLVIGVGLRLRKYHKIPAPLVIPTTPAPITNRGVVGRLLREVVFFESLFKGNKWTWLFGYLFHFGMFFVLLRHFRYFTDPVWGWVASIQWLGIYASYAMIIGLLGLWARRFFVDRVKYISAPSDHLMLVLLIGIGLSGLSMKYIWHTDVVALKVYMRGLLTLQWQPLPTDPGLLLHLLLVLILMAIFPFSKLLHGPALAYTPARNMKDTPREERHIAPWAERLDKD